MSRKLTKNEIIEQVNDLNMVFIRFINYNGKSSRFVVKCEYGHEEYETSLSVLNHGRAAKGCPACKYINKSKTNISKVDFNNIKSYVENYEFILYTKDDEYKGLKEDITMKCLKCGDILTINFVAFKKREKKCSKCNEIFHVDKAKQRALELNYNINIDRYENKAMKLDIVCDKGHAWSPTYESFVSNKCKCLYCNNEILSDTQKLDFEEVKRRINIEGNELLSNENEYKSNQSKLQIKCPKGHTYQMALSNFGAGKRCDKCNMSKGESKIYYILNKYNVYFITQYKFDDCRNINALPFDFFIPHYNLLIEFDGEQHYRIGTFNKSLLDLMNRKHIDFIKTNYCVSNNINLLRIPYWEFDNIEDILVDKLRLNKYE